MFRRRRKLSPAAEFADRTIADEAWATLMAAEVPATLEHTPQSLGQRGYTRLYVPVDRLDDAQRLIQSYVRRDRRG